MHKYVMIISVLMALMACGGRKQAQTAQHPENHDITAPVKPSADSLYALVEAQTALGPRTPGSDGNRRCRKLITDAMHRYGADTVIVHNTTVDICDGTTAEAANIMGRFNTSASRRVLLLAHYDTRPWADNDPDPANHTRPLPGANDGASGVAALIEIARLMAAQAPAVGVDLLFVDAEDSGCNGNADSEDSWCLGTQKWTQEMPYGSDSRPIFGILLDMVGGRDARFHREYISDLHARQVVDLVWDTAARSGLASRFVDEPGGAVTDDHLYINRAGIPCIDIIENKHPQTGTFNPTWHTMADDLPAIDPKTMADVVTVVANTIYSL